MQPGQVQAASRSTVRQGASEEIRPALPAQGLPLRPDRRHLHLPSRQEAVSERGQLQSQRPSGGEVSGRAKGLRVMPAARQMPAEAGDHPGPAGQLINHGAPDNHSCPAQHFMLKADDLGGPQRVLRQKAHPMFADIYCFGQQLPAAVLAVFDDAHGIPDLLGERQPVISP